MNDKEIVNLIETTLTEKLYKNDNYIRYTYYELKVKYNLNEDDLDRFLILIRTKLENDNYNVYFTDAKFIYENANRTVQPNEILIAIKN
ncbi:MAG: hypothetical protein J6D03_09390 [Clostridia bacterium]|nr:hypothetical protein [Clostridia bacterium]